jgi:CRISPR-associated protein Cas2
MSSQKLFYVIAYDITDNKRRTKVHNLLSGYCAWTQYSLFEGYLTGKQRIALEARLRKLLNAEQDSLRLYPLCAMDVEKVLTLGSEPPQEEGEYII